MEYEESLTNEQTKCKEVIRVRCDPLEAEIKLIK